MNEVSSFIFSMAIYTLAGGMWLGEAVERFKKGHYIRFGICSMFVVSIIMVMAQLCFVS